MDWKKKTHTLNTTFLVLLITMIVLNSTHTHFVILPATSPSPVPLIFYQLLAVLLIAVMFLLMFWIIYYMPLYIEFSHL
ncbi:MAG: hypothetical protein JHC26_06175 [Thermofilum sp.]|uniref:hypothetical protein n=1 Tax=Thermofilum sp. TaxID=1961369 RepID=UPI002590A2AC|nr:hypothetical protein [Thermofilum sp.]MCI4408658.1 hypothetical protein [Thermofilum sp.]